MYRIGVWSFVLILIMVQGNIGKTVEARKITEAGQTSTDEKDNEEEIVGDDVDGVAIKQEKVKQSAEKPNHDNVIVSIRGENQIGEKVWSFDEFEKELRNKLGEGHPDAEKTNEEKIDDNQTVEALVGDSEHAPPMTVQSQGNSKIDPEAGPQESQYEGKKEGETAPKDEKEAENKIETVENDIAQVKNEDNQKSDTEARVEDENPLVEVEKNVNEQISADKSSIVNDDQTNSGFIVAAEDDVTEPHEGNRSGFFSGISAFFRGVGSKIGDAASFIWETMGAPFKKNSN